MLRPLLLALFVLSLSATAPAMLAPSVASAQGAPPAEPPQSPPPRPTRDCHRPPPVTS